MTDRLILSAMERLGPKIEFKITKEEVLRLIYCEFYARTLFPANIKAKDVRNSIGLLTYYVELLERFDA